MATNGARRDAVPSFRTTVSWRPSPKSNPPTMPAPRPKQRARCVANLERHRCCLASSSCSWVPLCFWKTSRGTSAIRGNLSERADGRSHAGCWPDFDTVDVGSSSGVCRGFAERSLQRGQSLLEAGKRSLPDFLLLAGKKYRVIPPPIHAHFLGFVNGADDQPDLNREQFDINQFHPEIAGDNDSFVENALEDVRQCGRLDRM